MVFFIFTSKVSMKELKCEFTSGHFYTKLSYDCLLKNITLKDEKSLTIIDTSQNLKSNLLVDVIDFRNSNLKFIPNELFQGKIC